MSEVLEIVVGEINPGSGELCHLFILPVFPPNVIVPLLLPEQTVTSGLNDPPTVGGSTVIIAIGELIAGH